MLVFNVLPVVLGDNYGRVFYTKKELNCEIDLQEWDKDGKAQEWMYWLYTNMILVDKFFFRLILVCILFEWIITYRLIHFQKDKTIEEIQYFCMNTFDSNPVKKFQKGEETLANMFRAMVFLILPLN